MKFLIQRVKNASVEINSQIFSQINKGFLVFVGISDEDTFQIADKMINKMLGLRIFEDENDKINLGLKDVDGDLLIVSQFTLYADCKKGNRPGFTNAGSRELASSLYDYFNEYLRSLGYKVETGIFGADMKVKLINDGPFTIVLDSKEVL